MNIKKDILLGIAVGDALGVPVEFFERKRLKDNPVLDMREFGTHSQPKGTWSDDTSLAICLMESIIKDKVDIGLLKYNFSAWRRDSYWTATGEVFDIGIATRNAIDKIDRGITPTGGFLDSDNGNGSLMRILPLVLLTKEMSIEDKYKTISEVSSVTHGHIRSIIACFYYLEFAELLINGKNLKEAYAESAKVVSEFLKNIDVDNTEIEMFNRLFIDNIYELSEDRIFSSGYVLHSLEASIWCLLNSNSYEETVLKAVNLGGDTDTISAIAGGLAGIYYGYQSIPESWINVLARKEDLLKLCN